MKELILLILITFNLSANTLFINEKSISIKKSPSLNSETIENAELFDEYEVINVSKLDSVKSSNVWFKDNWYVVKTKNNEIGYVFGHFTSLKKDGQLSYIMVLENLNWEGNVFHFIFTEYTDFGKGRNQLGRYGKFILEDSYRKKPYLIGRKFNITYNYLKSEVNSKIEEVLTIVEFIPIKD